MTIAHIPPAETPAVGPTAPVRSVRAALRAALVHASLSLGVALVMLILLKTLWYPGAIFTAAGVADFLVILIGVDVILGPLFTAVIWVPGKKGLWRDMAIIVFLQMAGLAYGLHVLAQTRPVYWVATQDRLRLMTSQELSADEARALQPGWLPELRAAHLPDTAEGRKELMDRVLSGGRDIDRDPTFWKEYSTGSQRLWDRARPVEKLSLSEDDQERLRWAEWRHDVDLSKSRFVPFRVLRADISAVLHPVTHEPVAFLAEDPWGVQPVNLKPSRAETDSAPTAQER